MPWIIVATEEHARDRSTALLRERVSLGDFESDHFSAQLVERLGWAVLDAGEREHDQADGHEDEPAQPAATAEETGRELRHTAPTRRREPVRA
jgi:hypothetical protein